MVPLAFFPLMDRGSRSIRDDVKVEDEVIAQVIGLSGYLKELLSMVSLYYQAHH